MDKLRIFSGNGNPELAKSICSFLGVKVSEALVGRFTRG